MRQYVSGKIPGHRGTEMAEGSLELSQEATERTAF